MGNKRQRGFTLIEIVIGISITALMIPCLAVALQFMHKVPPEESAVLTVSHGVDYAAEWVSKDTNQANQCNVIGFGGDYCEFRWKDEYDKQHIVIYSYDNHQLLRKESIDGGPESILLIASGISDFTDVAFSKLGGEDSEAIRFDIKCTEYAGGEPVSKEGTFYMILRKGILTSLIPAEGLWPYRVPIDIDNSENPKTLGDYQIPVTFDKDSFPYYDHLAYPEDGRDIRFYAEYEVYPDMAEIPISITGSTATLNDYPVRVHITTHGLLNKIAEDGRDLRFYTYDDRKVIGESGNDPWEYEGLDYWIQTLNESGAVVWVEVPEIPSGDGTTIYMYYGDHSATPRSASTGAEVEEIITFFDDFSSETYFNDRWDRGEGGYPEKDSGVYVKENNLEIRVNPDSFFGIPRSAHEYAVTKQSFEFPATFNAYEDSPVTFWNSHGDVYVCPTRITSGNPANEPDWIRINIAEDSVWATGKVQVQKRVGGGSVQNLSPKFEYWPASYSLELTSTTANVYRDMELMWSGPHGLSFSQGYMYLSASCTSWITYVWLFNDAWICNIADPEPTATLETESVGKQEILSSHWIEDIDDDAGGKWWRQGPTEESRIWVKVPAIPAKSTQRIYMYYGNPEASDQSNVHDVFDIYDAFNDKSLEGWDWWNEPGSNGGSWDEGTTTPGQLHLVSDKMTDFREDQHNGNGIYRELPLGDFEMEVKLAANPEVYKEDYLQSGIMILQDEANFLKYGYGGRWVGWWWFKSYCSGLAVFREEDGSYIDVGIHSDKGSPKTIKMRRLRDTWYAQYKDDNTNWTEVETWVQPFSNPLKVGVGVADGNSNVNYPTDFDYVRVRKYTCPEPTGKLSMPYESGAAPSVARWDCDDDEWEDPSEFDTMPEFTADEFALMSQSDDVRVSHGNKVFLSSARYDSDDAVLESPAVFDTLIEFSAGEYSDIAQSDDDWVKHSIGPSSDMNKLQHVFQFKINEAPESINQLDVSWEGHSSLDLPESDGVNIWNDAKSSWEGIGDIIPIFDLPAQKTYTAEKDKIEDYINDTGNLYIMAYVTEDEVISTELNSDHVKVAIVDKDGKAWQAGILGAKVQHVFQCPITDEVASIDSLMVTWEGYCDNAPQAGGVMIWNNTIDDWEILGDVPVVEDLVSKTYSGNIGDYVDDSNCLYLMAYTEDESQPAMLYTDNVTITVFSSQSAISISGPEEPAPSILKAEGKL